MLWAEDSTGKRIEAERGSTAVCPLCRIPVTPKCGELVQWHWAHRTGESCDPWSEGETPWHRWWKSRAPVDRQEVVIGNHRADILVEKGVVELQHSPIDAAEIREREAHYGKMIWLLDGRQMSFHSMQFDFPVPRLEERYGLRDSRHAQTGRQYWEWRWPRTSFLAARKAICIDLCSRILVAETIMKDGRAVVLYGRMLARNRFLEELGLTSPTADDRSRVMSYLVQYRRAGDRMIKDGPEATPRTAPYPMEWREFATQNQLDRWRNRHQLEAVDVYLWHADGSLTTDEGDPVRSAIDPTWR